MQRDILIPEHGEVVSKLLRDRAKVIDRHPNATPEQLDKLIAIALQRRRT